MFQADSKGLGMNMMRRMEFIGLLCVGFIALNYLKSSAQLSAGSDEEGANSAVHESMPSRHRLFDKMGSYTRTITTKSTLAQQHFSQGLTWAYAFNHDEAIRSFLKAAHLDPHCAMAWWGIAYCEGPNYNDNIMTEDRSKAAWYALQNALARLDHASPVERALIQALTCRYACPWPEDRAGLEQGYADAMADVWEKFPQDADVGTLYAEAMMLQKPWMLYTVDQKPVEGTERIVAVLEDVLDREPNHPGANHFYIHAVEPSANPGQGLGAARRLTDLVPASGHLLHMPSHIYVKTGFWNDAIVQNRKAMEADARYRSMSPKQGMQHLYMVHNAHMRAYAAMMSGREKEAMAAARAMWENIPEDALREVGPIFDLWMCSVYDVQKRFGRWDDILSENSPPPFLPITHAIWRAHRAIAYAAKKDFDAARSEHQCFRQEMNGLPEGHMAFLDSAKKILEVSDLFIGGEIALQQEKWGAAAELLVEAAKLEDSLSYGEPPQWLQPVRHTLGAVHLKAKRFDDAERVYREDLAKWPKNGWSLYGLSQALKGQGNMDAADKVRQQYELAWALADAPTTTSCKCIPTID
jgi:tetratricopeptide (TPR) repeat protein